MNRGLGADAACLVAAVQASRYQHRTRDEVLTLMFGGPSVGGLRKGAFDDQAARTGRAT